jgi:hypothetical protein
LSCLLPISSKAFTNWTRTSAESLTSFSLVLSLGDSLPATRKQVDEILRANPLGTAANGKVSELGETSVVVESPWVPLTQNRIQLKSEIRAYFGLS